MWVLASRGAHEKPINTRTLYLAHLLARLLLVHTALLNISYGYACLCCGTTTEGLVLSGVYLRFVRRERAKGSRDK